MEEDNKESIPKMVQEEQTQTPEQEPTNNVVQEQTTEPKFRPLGEINEKTPKKKKSKAGAIVFILLLLVAIIGGLAYYYFEIYTNPKVIYQQIIKAGITSLSETPDEMTTIKAKTKLDVDVDLNENYMESGVEEVLNLINNIDATIEIQMDTNEKKAVFKFASNYEDEELLNCDMLFDAKNRGTYVKLEQFFDDVLEVEIEDEYYDELENVLDIEEETAGQKLSRSKAVGILKAEFEKIIKDEYCSKEKAKITVDSEEVNADKYILKMTYAELIDELTTTLENLKNNEEFLKCFEDKEDKKEILEETINEINAEKIEEDAILYINLYKIGIKQECVRVDFEVETAKEKLILKVEKAEETYKFELLSKDEIYCKGTIEVEKVNETTSKMNLNVEVDKIGTIVLNMEYEYVLNEQIDTMETEDAVNMEDLSQADMLKAYANLLESKLYKIVEEFSGFPEDTESDGDFEIESSNTTIDKTMSDIEKNISTSAELPEKSNLVVFATNNNSTPIDMEIEVEFYDADGNFLGSSSDDLMAVGAGREVAVEMWNTPANFSTYKIYVDAEKTDVTNYFDQIEMVHNNNGKNIVVQVKNKSEDTIEFMTVSVVYYNQGKVVGIADGVVSDIKPGRAGNFNIDYPYNSEYEDIKFDDYKVYIAEAYSYNW